jgi:hypothetical protein
MKKHKIIKHYHRDKYYFYVMLESGKMDCTVNFLHKSYNARISDDFKRVNLIDNITIYGIMGDKPKQLQYLTIYKYNRNGIQEYVSCIL